MEPYTTNREAESIKAVAILAAKISEILEKASPGAAVALAAALNSEAQVQDQEGQKATASLLRFFSGHL